MDIIIKSQSAPEDKGYLDGITVISNPSILFHGSCSVCPNPFSPILKKEWKSCYAWISCGTYLWQCIRHKKYGKCLFIGDCPTRLPNPNSNLYLATGIFIHKGWTDKWRGSKGCITIPPSQWKEFMDCFTLSDKGRMEIIDAVKFA